MRGRNVDWGVSAVRDAANITAQQALDLGVIDLVEPDLASVLTAINGMTFTTSAGTATINTTNARIDRIGLSYLENFLQFLANPTLAYLLVSFGMLALYVELSHPGIGFAAIGGVIALLLGLLGLGSLPVAWFGLGLMALSFVLFVADLFVPSLGMLTIGGLISFLIGSNILIAEGSPDGLRVPEEVVWTMTICLAVFAAALGLLVIKGQLRRTVTGKTGMVGMVGTAQADLDPDGIVLVFGELWKATATGDNIKRGEHVAVEQINGLSIRVRRATSAEIASTEEVADRRAVIPVR